MIDIVQKVPEKIGPYPIEHLIGKGGSSHVYLGSRPATHDPVIIKVLSPNSLLRKDLIDRFLKEAEIVAMTDHPNIVKWYGHGEWEGGLYIALEFIEGISLKRYMQRFPISLRRALEITIEIAYALCHLHTHGVIHRDLKPENILIADTGQVKVIDFGISQLLSDKKSLEDLSKAQLIGTLSYMSPEQEKAPNDVSYPSDIYSLGIIAYELILGTTSQGKVHLSLMPQGLQKILSRALQPNPKERYLDVVDFISDLSSYLHSPAMEKESRPRDIVGALSDQLQVVDQLLSFQNSDHARINKIFTIDQNASEIYGFTKSFWDFPEEKFGLLIAKPLCKGLESIAAASLLKGLAEPLFESAASSEQFVERLQQQTSKFLHPLKFHLNYLLIDQREKKLDYCSLGFGLLWHFSNGKAERIAPDEPVFRALRQWREGDFIILLSANPSDDLQSEKIPDPDFHSVKHLAQIEIKKFFRKIERKLGKSAEGSSLTLISIFL
jgi:serine/threonine protein kinase